MSTTIEQRGQSFVFDVLVIGSGVAGLCYCLELLALRPHSRIALVTKGKANQSATYCAQGGIAAAQSTHDITHHINDTIGAGDGLCIPESVKAIVEKGPQSIDYLIKQGVVFDKDEENKSHCAQEAGHSNRRIFHQGDHTGAGIAEALLSQLTNHPTLQLFTDHSAVNLITQTVTRYDTTTKEVVGAYILDQQTLSIHTFLSNITVLATGGAGKVYRFTSNPPSATGDGVAMAYRAGARVEGLEFYQFHPTLLYHPQLNNFLLSETLRGEGAYLRLPATGERFMQRYAPLQMELATRDIIARAIFTEIEGSKENYVHLDIRHKTREFLEKRFPLIYQTLLKQNLDLSRDLIPIVPAAHYMCGGIVTSLEGRTDISRLYAIGETAYTGLHGANRLASNSLLEGVVMGRNAALASTQEFDRPIELGQVIPVWDSTGVVDIRRATQIHSHWRGLRGEMNAYAGIIRTKAGLQDQLQLILTRKEMIEAYYWKHVITRDLLELRNIILVAELIVRAALHRQESRGGHYRADQKTGLSDVHPIISPVMSIN